MAIALPKFLLDKENKITVLACFFFVLLIIVPSIFYMKLTGSSQDVGGVSVENRRTYAQFINENLIFKNCPILQAHSFECKGRRVTNTMMYPLTSLSKSDAIREKEAIPKQTQKLGNNYDGASLVMILGYLLRLPQAEDPALQVHMEDILKYAPFHIEQMLFTAIEMSM